MVNELNKKHKKEIIEQRRQALTRQDKLFKYYESRYKQHLEEAREKDRTVAHLRKALEIQQKALVKYLQAELEEMANLTLIDNFSARIVEEEEADAWLEENSKKSSRYDPCSPGLIFARRHGSARRGNVDEAAEEAELKLRRVIQEVGLDEPLDNTLPVFSIRKLRTEYRLLERLFMESEGRVEELMQVNDEMGKHGEEMKARVGVLEGEKEAVEHTATEAEETSKKPSEQHGAIQHTATEAEETAKKPSEGYGAIQRTATEAEETAKKPSEEDGAIKHTTTEAEETAKQPSGEHRALEGNLIDTETLIKELIFENCELSKKNKDLEGQVKAQVGVLEGEKEAIQRTATEAEETAKKPSEEHRALEENLTETQTLIKELILENCELSKKNKDLKGRVKALEDEKSSLQRLANDTKRLNEILKTQHSEEEKRAHSFEEAILALRRHLAREGEDFARSKTQIQNQIAELQSLEEKLQNSTATINYFERALLNTKLTTSKLQSEKESLKNDLDKAAREAEASGIRFAQLLKDAREMWKKNGEWVEKLAGEVKELGLK